MLNGTIPSQYLRSSYLRNEEDSSSIYKEFGGNDYKALTTELLQLKEDTPKQQIQYYYPKAMEPGQSENKPPVVTNDHNPAISPMVAGPKVGTVASGGAGPTLHPSGSAEFLLKEIMVQLGGEPLKKDKTCSTYDLVKQMQYLYVRVVKAQEMALFGGVELFCEVKLGNYRGITKTAALSNAESEWDQVFAFSKDCIQSSTVEIFLKESNKEEYMGRVCFDLREVPRRVPPDSQLEPQWHRVEDKKGDKAKTGELMISIWFGTQADEAFSKAWHSNDANVHFDVHSFLKSKVYLSPKLWYLRVSIIEAQDIMPGHRGSNVVRFPEFSAKVQLGNQYLRTKNAAPSATRSFSNPYWNEELFFVVAEPFENDLLISVEDQVEPGRDVVVARVLLPVATIEKRAEEKPVSSKWFDLDSHFGNTGNKNQPIIRFVSQIHLRVSFDGGYNLVDEDTMDKSDVWPANNRLRKPHIGVLEIGVLGALGLKPMKTNHGRGVTNAYCVVKYGRKWVRTRTVVDSMTPKWNEQYVWEVYDPCTVVTIGVFHNRRIDNNTTNKDGACDFKYGKIRIRLSTLETDRVYTHSYPLMMLLPSGLKKMGELQLAVRFSCANVTNMLYKYTIPVLPKMHYVHPLSEVQLNRLRNEAVNLVASRLSRVELPLGREVVEYMLYHDDSPVWSFRRSKVAFYRIMSILSGLVAMVKWLQEIRNWQKPVYSALFLIIFLMLVMLPEFIIPTILLYLASVGLWNYRYRPRHPPHLDIRLSHAEDVHLDELDEEFDTTPSSCSGDIVNMRYDRLRSVLGRLQTITGDVATMIERLQALVSWREPRATFLFMVFCLVAVVGFYAVSIRVVVALLGLYSLRPPRLRSSKLPSPALSFFRRLPSKTDNLIYETVESECLDIEGLLITKMLENFQQCVSLFV